jgi:hypothetical protein
MDEAFMKHIKALLLILGQWGLHEIGIHTCPKFLHMILDRQGLHEEYEGFSADSGSLGTS